MNFLDSIDEPEKLAAAFIDMDDNGKALFFQTIANLGNVDDLADQMRDVRALMHDDEIDVLLAIAAQED